MACTHLDQIQNVSPTTENCEECMKEGTEWVQLRECLTCGHVGCCDSSEGRHATRHFKETNHPIMQSFKSGDEWKWCYIDEDYVS